MDRSLQTTDHSESPLLRPISTVISHRRENEGSPHVYACHKKCQVMLNIALETSPYAKLLLGAMKQHGCTVYKDRHFSCEECDVSRETAEKAVDEVFDSCFNDHEPFGRIPRSKKDAKYAYRDFTNCLFCCGYPPPKM
ncbi:mitochondrial inner membrane protease ATP23 homolog [Spea bombifrons]|uniref:mitochondrial inner membrane protease ATP23 homolog n=1 Tax=Spea bombifrons TaxID=233779 RepID=UPI0023493D64|nr:mitochondrial inner membrane protease ATP23 homolog [Spea bombifrons]